MKIDCFACFLHIFFPFVCCIYFIECACRGYLYVLVTHFLFGMSIFRKCLEWFSTGCSCFRCRMPSNYKNENSFRRIPMWNSKYGQKNAVTAMLWIFRFAARLHSTISVAFSLFHVIFHCVQFSILYRLLFAKQKRTVFFDSPRFKYRQWYGAFDLTKNNVGSIRLFFSIRATFYVTLIVCIVFVFHLLSSFHSNRISSSKYVSSLTKCLVLYSISLSFNVYVCAKFARFFFEIVSPLFNQKFIFFLFFHFLFSFSLIFHVPWQLFSLFSFIVVALLLLWFHVFIFTLGIHFFFFSRLHGRCFTRCSCINMVCGEDI